MKDDLHPYDWLTLISGIVTACGIVAYHVYRPWELSTMRVGGLLNFALVVAASYGTAALIFSLTPSREPWYERLRAGATEEAKRERAIALGAAWPSSDKALEGARLAFVSKNIVNPRSLVVSNVHALVSVYLSYIATIGFKGDRSWGEYLLFPESLSTADRAQYWLASSGAANFCMAVSFGYIAFDSTLLFLDPKILPLPMKIHHAAVLVAFTAAYGAGFASPFTCLLVMNEASTFFVNNNFSWAKAPWARITNGIGLFLSFLIFRILLNSVVGVVMYRTQSSLLPHIEIQAFLWLMFSSLQCLNVSWFYQICVKLVSAIAGQRKPKVAAASKEKNA